MKDRRRVAGGFGRASSKPFPVVFPFHLPLLRLLRHHLLLRIPSLHQFHLDQCCCHSGRRRSSMPLLPITPSSDEAPPPPRGVAESINPSRSKKPGPSLYPIIQFPPSIRPCFHLLPPSSRGPLVQVPAVAPSVTTPFISCPIGPRGFPVSLSPDLPILRPLPSDHLRLRRPRRPQ